MTPQTSPSPTKETSRSGGRWFIGLGIAVAMLALATVAPPWMWDESVSEPEPTERTITIRDIRGRKIIATPRPTPIPSRLDQDAKALLQQRFVATIPELEPWFATEADRPDAQSAFDEGYKVVGFDVLASFPYDKIDDALGGEDRDPKKVKEFLPEEVKVLDGEELAIDGYMVPMDSDLEGITSFLLVQDLSLCCYGRIPDPHQWMSVDMKEGSASRYFNDIAIRVYGSFHIEEEERGGRSVRIYRMDADKLKVSPKRRVSRFPGFGGRR